MLEIVWQSLWWILPAYIANASAVLVGGGRPIDFNKKWRGKPIFGRGKTWRGFIGGGMIGFFAGLFMKIFSFDMPVPIILSFSFGALLGDLIESFVKRRIGKKRGEKWIIADQIDFVLGALFFSYIASWLMQPYTHKNWFMEHLTIWHILFLLLITPLIHLATNILAHAFKFKEVPW